MDSIECLVVSWCSVPCELGDTLVGVTVLSTDVSLIDVTGSEHIVVDLVTSVGSDEVVMPVDGCFDVAVDSTVDVD